MRTEAAVALLRRTRLFAGLSEETLAALGDRSVERSYPRHARLFYQGDPGRAGAEATELLELVAELGVQATGIDWSGDLGLVLEALGRGAELLELAAGVPAPTRWLRAGTAVAAGYLRGGSGLRSASA